MSLPVEAFEGIVYRAHHPRWAVDPESGEGASRHGGRFNRRGTPALYASLRVETAWLEAQQGFPFKAQPMTLCAYAVHCVDILDLSSADVRRAAAVTLEELACPWEDLADRGHEPPSWAVAARLAAEGMAGIIVPSFAHRAGSDDRNLILWKWGREKPHQLRVIDDHRRLPSNDLSWTAD
ncbi:RES family NAD+ phosphorylase [Sphingomonas quercus]|uniref:RES domain-containing protein n=1 Tax=Sphingomonas quercus TaxID=2842451 RepID=A0ABS6BM66_9SPHN|nr:RES domain-containing protein [Sphingomonas quercus]MBU3078866.1 RES domain-containing protein [Sphingomonas quercus]